MSDLTKFRAHCAQMATAEHKPDCPSLAPASFTYREPSPEYKGRLWMGLEPVPRPACDGCVTPSDRALFGLLAAEVDDYLAPQPDLFGELTTEPTTHSPDPRPEAAT